MTSHTPSIAIKSFRAVVLNARDRFRGHRRPARRARNPRLLSALACAGVLLAAAAPAAPAAPQRAKPCPPAKAAVARSLQAQLHQRSTGDDRSNHTLLGCHLGTRRRTVLARWYSCECSIGDDQAPQAWLIGRHVAVNGYSCSPTAPLSECTGRLRVIDLRTGRTLHRADSGGPVGGLLLKPGGSVAYVRDSLTRIDRSGTTVLDPGPGIDPSSLATDGKRLYWLHDGQPRVAPFE